ncbi:MAG: WXG100 family type VII secretion target [Labedaea sp.]
MAGFTAGSPELVSAGKAMEDTNGQLMDQARQLAQAVDAVNWQGAAKAAFVNLMTKFSQDTKTLNDSLNNIAEQIGSSAADYSAQEQQAASDLSAISSALEGI